MNPAVYIPLRLHTEFSITDGTVRIKNAVKRALDYRLPALAISDLMNGFGWVKFYKACRGAGIKPLLATDVWISNPANTDHPFRALLLARNEKGYLRLNELLTRAYVGSERQGDRAQLDAAWFDEGDNSGLVCLSGAHYGEVGVNLINGHEAAAREAARKYAALFPDAFYL